ncbi:hypothetical protein Q9L42_020390 (plasmid) [Methylomarinum sp. Ch1-1]|uniref:Uncharacterized protein n=1 Tax=Methylomarinum roseum TaxID=3067653 RepID=A0AAU7P004_9GAMM
MSLIFWIYLEEEKTELGTGKRVLFFKVGFVATKPILPGIDCPLTAGPLTFRDLMPMTAMGRDLMASLFEMNHCQRPL